MRLRGKIALVTGSARGIGAAIAEAFVREGAHVIVSDLNHAGAVHLAQCLGGGSLGLLLDVREEDQWGAALEKILDRFGRLDVLVNNAGITGFEGGATRSGACDAY